MQIKKILNMKIVVSYLNFTFHVEVKTKSQYKILNFSFQIYQKHEMTLLGTKILILACLGNSFSSSFVKMKNEK